MCLFGRCVLEKLALRFNTFAGGGGGGAPYIKNLEIPKNVIESNIGGEIILYGAAGGAGGSAGGSSGAAAGDGSNGAASSIKVNDASGKLKWGIEVPGGLGGKGATSSDYGDGGGKKAQNTCREYNGTSWVNRDCSSYGPNGVNGNYEKEGNTSATGGAGGGSAYNYSSFTGGGSGGDSNSENGMDGSRYGAGGGGGTVRFQISGSTSNVYKGKGGRGANGIAEIQYDIVYPAAGGGGGGGGAFAIIKDIPVSAGVEYTIRVGGGGAAGGVGSNGADGGATSITFDSLTYTLKGGTKGSAGTSATSSSDAVQGKGGAGGGVYTSATDTSNLDSKAGSSGKDGKTFTSTNGFGGSSGGVGGDSGLGTKGSCGGLFIDSTVCTNTNVNGSTVVFVAPNNVYDSAQYGAAGAGGGGGGWSEDTTNYPNPGGGSAGQNGYVYLNWIKYDD